MQWTMRTTMRGAKALGLAWAMAGALAAQPAVAESKNIADYPLRLHIYSRSEITFYHHRYPDESKGDGRANLFENGTPHGVDFNFECDKKIRTSFGYETYPAKWKKPGQELVVLLPVFGEAGHFFTCTFKTDVKTAAYVSRNGSLREEPADEFRAWMVRHDYDPEHGKDVPTQTAPEAGAPAAAPSQSAPPPDRSRDTSNERLLLQR